MSEALEVAEDNRSAVFVRQPAHLLMHDLGALILFGPRLAVSPWTGRRQGLGDLVRPAVSDAPADRPEPDPGRHPHRDAMQPASDRFPVADRAGPAGQDQKDSLKCVVDILRVVKDVPADAHNHRSMPGHQGFERQLASLVAASHEAREQLPVAQSDTRAGPEKRLELLGKPSGRRLGFTAGPLLVKVVLNYSAPESGSANPLFSERIQKPANARSNETDR